MALTIPELISEETYRELALLGENRLLELYRGHLQEKPAVSYQHSYVASGLVELLLLQLDRGQFRVSLGQARLRVSSSTYYIPDVVVIPAGLERSLRLSQPLGIDAYEVPMPLVVEIWSPSTGAFDIEGKLPDYQKRGDLEIWYIHPYQRFLRAWRRQPDGSYVEATYRDGTVRAESLPNVECDTEMLFAP